MTCIAMHSNAVQGAQAPGGAGDIPSAGRGATDTSAQALEQLGLRALNGQRLRIFELVVAAQRNGAQDLSLREIQQRYESRHGVRIDVGTVSARVHNLVAAGWLLRVSATRPCAVTGAAVHAVWAPAKQARLIA